MQLLIAQAADGLGSIAVQGAVGLASLAIVQLFLKHQREREAQAEREHERCEETIVAIVSKHETAVNTLTGSFRTELAHERQKRDEDRKEFRESLHILRNQSKPQ